MKRSLFQILKIIGFLALGVLLLFFAFRGVAMDELASTLRKANFWWVGLSLLFLFISMLSRARRWTLLIDPLGYKPSFRNTYHSLMVGYLSNFALPRLGEVTRCVTLGKREKIPVDSLFGTVIIERVVDLIMLLLILLILLISWMEKFGAFFGEQIFDPLMQKVLDTFGGTWIFWLLVAGGVLIILLILFLLRKPLGRIPIVKKIFGFIKGLSDGLKTIYKMKRKWEFVFHSIFIWVLYILLTWVLVFALKDTSGLTFIDGVFLLVIGGLGMAAPVTAGFGAFHWIVSRGLMVVYDLTLEQGTAYAILAHESNSIFTIILGAFSYILLMTTRNKTRPLEKTD